MAVLFGDELFRCKCGNARFEEVVIKSYNKTNEKTLKVNSSSKELKCTKCNEMYPINDFTGYSIVE